MTDNDLIAGGLLVLGGAVVGAVLQWRLSFYLARGLRADERREAALLALEDQAAMIGQLADSHARIGRENERPYVQTNIWVPLEKAVERMRADWDLRLSDAASRRAREIFGRLVAQWEVIPAELAKDWETPSDLFWSTHLQVAATAYELADVTRHQLRAEYGIRKVWWRRLLRR